jgi:UDP-galactopyranose mutase
LSTINQFYKKTYSPDQARKKIQEVQVELTESLGENFEGKAISLMGTDLYNAFFKNYTFKQWQTDPRKLPKSTITRLPFRFNYNNDYFDDKYQGIPLDGYTNWITKLLSKTTVFLNTDFLKIKSQITQDKLIIYTGPIDKYFNYQFGELAWRTLDFKLEIKKLNDFQGNSVINYADLEVDYTRIHEFKHLHPERNYQENSTLIMYEFSKFADRIDEPYYPVNSESDKLKLSKYRALIKNEKNIFFGGRLGSYQYLDMHMAIASALAMFENEIIVRLNELRLI